MTELNPNRRPEIIPGRLYSRRNVLFGALAFAAVPVLAACSSGGDDDGDSKKTVIVAGDDSPYEAALLTNPLDKPALVLPDTSGKDFDLKKETDGFVTLLYVGYVNCPDICPLHMVRIKSALEKMPAEQVAKVKTVFITSDPERDTPEKLRTWLDNFGTGFIGLVPKMEQLNDVTSALGMPPIKKEDIGGGNYAVDHAAFVLAFDRNTNAAHLGFLGGMEQEIYDHDIPLLVTEGFSA